jgi:hypothetical protein
MEPNKKKMPQKTISFVNLANGRYGTAQKLIKETSSLFLVVAGRHLDIGLNYSSTFLVLPTQEKSSLLAYRRLTVFLLTQ